VRLASYRFQDLRAKMNAQKTLSRLQDLYVSPAMPAQLTGQSQFFPVRRDGKWENRPYPRWIYPARCLLGSSCTKPRAKVGVARAYVVKKASVALNKADAYVEYGALGELDSQLRFTSLDANGSVVRQNYKLLFDNNTPRLVTEISRQESSLGRAGGELKMPLRNSGFRSPLQSNT